MLQQSPPHPPLGATHQLATAHRDLVVGGHLKTDGRRVSRRFALACRLGHLQSQAPQTSKQPLAQAAVAGQDITGGTGIGLTKDHGIGQLVGVENGPPPGWPTYHLHARGMARLSINGDTLKQDWLSEDAKYPNEWFAFNTYVIYKNHIFFLTQKESGLCCVDAETGERKWFEDKYDFGNLLRVGDKMIMLSEKGDLIWGDLGEASFKETHRQKILDGLCWSKPVLLGNLLYARNAQGTVVCLELK